MENVVKEEIGKNIRAARIAANLSIDELADKMSSSSAYVGLVERGRRSFAVVDMVKLANILDVSINELMPTGNIENFHLVSRVIKSMRQMDSAGIEKVISFCESIDSI